MREGSGDCDGDRLGTVGTDLVYEVSQLGQLVCSYMTEVEHVEEQERRAAGDELLEADGFLEGATQPKRRRPVTNAEGADRRFSPCRLMGR